MNNFAEQTLASIVTQQFQSVQILEKYNLDFCCKGKKTLAAACEDKGLPLEQILQELNLVLNNDATSKAFNEMNAEELISFIILNHHFYVKQSLPTIMAHLEKVIFKHGEHFPFMKKVVEIFTAVKDEMLSHLQKEELVLFPKIRELETFISFNSTNNIQVNDLRTPISVIEVEHEFVGNAMNSIKALTNNYAIEDSMCTTFKITIAELKYFEENLHKHVHLENNILFPMAEKMYQQLITNAKLL